MNEQLEAKRTPTIVTVAIALTFVYVAMFFMAVLAIRTLNFVIFFCSLGVGLISLIISIIALCKHRGTGTIVATVINSLLFVSQVLFVLAFLSLLFTLRRTYDDDTYANRERISIQSVKESFPSENALLITKESEETEYYYYDYDGKVAKEFKSLDFKWVSDNNCHKEMSPTYFELNNGATVKFSYDYQNIEVRYNHSFFIGYSTYVSTYSIPEEESVAFKKVLDDTIAEEFDNYEQAKVDAISTISLENALSSMKIDNPSFICMYFTDYEPHKYIRVMDENDEILTLLESFDSASLPTFECESFTQAGGFSYYYANKVSPYSINYYHNEKCLKITKNYEDVYKNSRSVYICYQLTDMQDADLMYTVKKVLGTNQEIQIN